jgi:integrase
MSDRNLRKRGRIYWYRIRRAGKTHEGSLQTENKGLARERLAEKLRELKAAGWGDAPKRTFKQAAERFAAEHFKAIKPSTAQRYYVSIGHLLDHFEKTRLADIGSSQLYAFEQKRRKQGAAAPTIRRDLACLSSIWSACETWEWTGERPNPIKPYMRGRARSGGLREAPARQRYLSHDEEKEILAEAAQKAKVAIAFAIETGLRKEEQFSLRRTDVDLKQRELTIRAEVAKSGKRRSVPLFERAVELLKAMPARLDSPYVFTPQGGKRYSATSPTMYEALQRAVRRANKLRKARGEEPMAHVEWHDLRRTCGCRLLQDRGFTMEEVCKWLGHASVQVTERHYAFLTKEQLHRRTREAEVVGFRGKGA